MALFPDRTYILYDPCEGDRDVDIRMQKVSMVTVRKPHPCHAGLAFGATPHDIQPGERARRDSALVEGEWGCYYECIPCMDKWLRDECGLSPEDEHKAAGEKK